MAAQKTQQSAEKKRRSKKRKSRTEISSSSESESEAGLKNTGKGAVAVQDSERRANARSAQALAPSKKKTSKQAVEDAALITSLKASAASTTKPTPPQVADDFTALYLRKITGELADDLDKVRAAQDFKASSVAMLVHALKQGGEVFSVEEQRRFCGQAG